MHSVCYQVQCMHGTLIVWYGAWVYTSHSKVISNMNNMKLLKWLGQKLIYIPKIKLISLYSNISQGISQGTTSPSFLNTSHDRVCDSSQQYWQFHRNDNQWSWVHGWEYLFWSVSIHCTGSQCFGRWKGKYHFCKRLVKDSKFL